MHFTKMEGCGNDYIYIDGSKENVEDKQELAKKLSDRNFGIGGDGIIFINPGKEAEFEMEMYNADGSRSEMCGNGIRCVAKYIHDKGLSDSNPLTIESFGVTRTVDLHLKDDKVDTVTVNMGAPILEPERIPAVPETPGASVLIDCPLKAGDETYRITCVSMGNPHAVIFTEDTETVPLEKAGPVIEHHERFPNNINVEFVKVVDESHIVMRVWERGTGETLACGTGACASVTACILNGKTGRNVEVKLKGGVINVEWRESDNNIYMTGPAKFVFEGDVEI
ncbi:MAG: diaminopimelate epimerase [Lachnospiraceae bacterium]|nr:diaminopimelate epimerase [Lachnospiraceae bacterium]